MPVPSRIHLDAPQWASAVQSVRASRVAQRAVGRGHGAGGAAQEHRLSPAPMNLCGFEVGLDRPLFVIAGPCVVESRQLALDTAGELKEICSDLDIPFVYKSSYDK